VSREDNTFYLYTVTNKVNGKVYIGRTVDPMYRWRGHMYEASYGKKHYFARALRKYGKDGFDWKVVSKTDSWEASGQEEIRRISEAHDNGVELYNTTSGGDGVLGYKFTEESTSRRVAKVTGRKNTAETKAKMSLAAKGRVIPQATRDKISATLKGRKRDPEAIVKSADARRGMKNTDSHNQAIRRAKTGVPLSEAHRAALTSGWTARREECAALVDAGKDPLPHVNRGRKHTEEEKSRMRGPRKPLTAEHKQKISDAVKAHAENRRASK
jgi:group I intron endonuclease